MGDNAIPTPEELSILLDDMKGNLTKENDWRLAVWLQLTEDGWALWDGQPTDDAGYWGEGDLLGHTDTLELAEGLLDLALEHAKDMDQRYT